MKESKRSLLTSLTSLLLCFVMLIGTTFAWFTDEVTSANNIIKAGKLDIGMHWSYDNSNWANAEGINADPVFDYDNWEPGYTEVRYIKVTNDGNLAFKYQMFINPTGTVGKLAEVIEVSYDVVTGNDNFVAPASKYDMGSLTKVGTLNGLIASDNAIAGGVLLPAGESAEGYYTKEIVVCIAFHMMETAGNEYQGASIGDAFGINLYATQFDYESDSFDNSYDDNAEWPEIQQGISAFTSINNNNLLYGTLANQVTISGNGISATLPADVKIANGATSLNLTVVGTDVDGNLTLGEGDSARGFDVHIDGIAADNTQPMIVNLGAVLEPGLSETEVKLYHTENGVPMLMTRVDSAADFAIHNQYTYDSATGKVSIYVASFSVFSAVKTSADVWDGEAVADGFASGSGTQASPYLINTAAQLVYFRNQVDAGVTYAGQFVKLGSDIDLAGHPFDPIGFGYYKDNKVIDGVDTNTVFMGTFDGGNHTIYNLYENCWELDPDKTNYKTYTYSTAGAGLFASIKDATIKNLAISGAEVVFECVDMGVLVGYAQGECHFENIVITDANIANYNRYTGGLVGEVSYGVDNNGDGYSHTFKNITIDSTVTVSGLWGSFGCGMGGVIGGKWGDATVLMENVISAAEMDVYNDVVSAYQWYAFRGCGMLIGHTEEPYSDGRHSGNATASFLTCKDVDVYYGDWVDYTYYQFAEQTDAEGNTLWYSNYPWVRAEEGVYCDAFSNIRYGIPLINGVKVTELSEEEFNAAVTDYTTITFDQLYGADRGMYGTNKHPGVNVSYSSPKTFYIENNLGCTNLKLHYTYNHSEETWTTIPDGIELFESNGVYRIDLPVGATSFKITADGGFETEAFIVSELTEKETYPIHTHNFDEGTCSCGASQTETWKKLTTETELQVGDLIVFVYEKDKMELSGFSTTGTVYGLGTEYDDFPSGLMVFEVVAGSSNGTIAFKNGDKYLYWTSGNSLATNSTLSENASWTVSIDSDANAKIANAADSTRVIQWNSKDPRFACYTSNQSLISIYVQTTKIVCAECVMKVVDQKVASCGVAGYTIEKCSICGKETRTEHEALVHDYNGSNPYICTNNCGIHNLPEAGSTITIQEALWIAETLENGKETSGKYVITGVIDDENHPSDTGATTIRDGEHTIYITNIHNVDGTIRHDSFTVKLKDGNEITVSAKIAKNPSGEAQLHETWLKDHTDINPIDHNCDVCGAENVTDHNYVDGTCNCGETEPVEPTHECESVCETCGKCTDAECEEDACTNKCNGHNTTTEPTWVKTDLADIKADDIVVIVWTNGNTSWAISSANGSSGAPVALVVTVDGNQLTGEIKDAIKWNISNDNGNLTIHPNGTTATWLYCTNNNNGVRVGTNANKVFTIDAASGYLKNTETSRYVGVYTTNPDVRCYTSTTTNIAGQTLSFYVYSEGTSGGDNGGSEGGETECIHTNTTTTTVDATCTESGSVTITCDACGEIVSTEEISATGHINTNTTTDDATCTESGSIIVSCNDCGVNVSTQEIEALGHTAANAEGKCDRCGIKLSVSNVEKELSFSSTANRTVFNTSQQVWEANGITLTNDKGSGSNVADYANPARFYKGSKIVVKASGKITKIVFDCNTTAYATDLKNSIGTISGATVTVSSDKVTVEFTSAVESFTIAKLSGQVRMDSITVTYTPNN